MADLQSQAMEWEQEMRATNSPLYKTIQGLQDRVQNASTVHQFEAVMNQFLGLHAEAMEAAAEGSADQARGRSMKEHRVVDSRVRNSVDNNESLGVATPQAPADQQEQAQGGNIYTGARVAFQTGDSHQTGVNNEVNKHQNPAEITRASGTGHDARSTQDYRTLEQVENAVHMLESRLRKSGLPREDRHQVRTQLQENKNLLRQHKTVCQEVHRFDDLSSGDAGSQPSGWSLCDSQSEGNSEGITEEDEGMSGEGEEVSGPETQEVLKCEADFDKECDEFQDCEGDVETRVK